MKLKHKITTTCLLLAMVPGVTVNAAQDKESLKDEILQNKEVIEQKYEEKKEIENKLEKIGGEMQEISSKLSTLLREIQLKEGRINELNGAIQKQEKEVQDAVMKVSIAETRIDARIKDIREKEEELIVQQTLLDERVRASYKQNRQNGIITLLLESEGFVDFFERLKFIERMTEKDNEAIASINEMILSIEEEKAQLENERRTLLIEKSSLENERMKLVDSRAAIIDEKKSMEHALEDVRELEAEKTEAISRMNDEEIKIAQEIGDIMSENENLEAALQEMIREEQRKAEAARKEREEAEKANGNTSSSQTPSSNGYLVPAKGRISSPYGYRIHPIWNVKRMHTGIDIAAPSGTPIVATKSGTVITSRYMNSYGNTVIVDHGNGVSSLYAHMSAFNVKAGDVVNQGQRLGSVGSTGDSTGPHLHFEIRINGTHTNPSNYIN